MFIKVFLLGCIGTLALTASAFDVVTKPVGSFRYGNRRVNIWPSVDNTPEIPSSRWSFRYDPVILPLVDENNTILITTTAEGFKWRTDFLLSYDDVTLNNLAYEKIRKIFKDVKELSEENVNVLPVKRIVLRFPMLPEDFSEDMMNSSEILCPARASCFDFYLQRNQFRVSFSSSTKLRAEKLVEAIRSTQIHYEIHSYAKLENLVALEILYDHLDLFISVVGFPSASFQTQIERKSVTLEDKLLHFVSENVSSRFHEISQQHSSTNRRLDNVESNIESHIRETMLKWEKIAGWPSLCGKGGWHYRCLSTECFCYLLNTVKLASHQASDHCKSLTSELTSIRSSVEQEIVSSLINGDTWINDSMQSEGNVKWHDGSKTNYSNFKSSASQSAVHCTRILKENKKWENHDCRSVLHSVCRKNPTA